jgi:hypothetical protein
VVELTVELKGAEVARQALLLYHLEPERGTPWRRLCVECVG